MKVLSMIDPQILKLVRCPISGRQLEVAAPQLIERVNQAILAKRLENRLGQSITEPMEGALVDEAHEWLLPVRRSVITMVADELVLLKNLE
jgi:uncharacterized protein YbaR (Trm112 family)